jgi:hypothetical protein
MFRFLFYGARLAGRRRYYHRTCYWPGPRPVAQPIARWEWMWAAIGIVLAVFPVGVLVCYLIFQAGGVALYGLIGTLVIAFTAAMGCVYMAQQPR